MKNQLILFLLFCIVGITACTKTKHENVITPVPLSVEWRDDTFSFDGEATFYTNMSVENSGKFLSYLNASDLHLTTRLSNEKLAAIQIILNPDAVASSDEQYEMEVSPKAIVITANSPAGAFYGVQSLLQLITAYGDHIPCMIIKDEPRFEYRGFHLDVSRHFFDKEFVKKQIDMMAYYKLNRFHWHLTDGAGWRMEIEQYPLLTEIAAWRPYKTWSEWIANGQPYSSPGDSLRFGGYYTKADLEEVVEYAADRFITIVPEIEMPGHSEEVLAVYPELSCSGKPYIDSDFCIGNDQTFVFLENVLSEAMSIFPSEYIHIGGDEATKKGWAQCPKCRERMKKEGLSNLDELQNYMILRIEKFLNGNGRKLMGWDEILDGDLSKTATVMAWRGFESGVRSIRQGNKTVMTPDAYCYFDHYQDAPPTQPEAMPSLITLAKAYSFDPAPDSLSQDERSLVYGVQANLWAERISTPEHSEYMAYPRMLALSEVAWSLPERKSYPAFRDRALKAVLFLKSKGYHPFDLENEVGLRPESVKPVKHIALGNKTTYSTPYHKKYTAAGEATLTDGLMGDWPYGDGRWQGFLETDIDVTIDLEKETSFKSVVASFMQDFGADIWMPSKVEIYVSSDGHEFRMAGEIPNITPSEERKVTIHDFVWEGSATARFIRFKAVSQGIPGGWLFTDEIVIK